MCIYACTDKQSCMHPTARCRGLVHRFMLRPVCCQVKITTVENQVSCIHMWGHVQACIYTHRQSTTHHMQTTTDNTHIIIQIHACDHAHTHIPTHPDTCIDRACCVQSRHACNHDDGLPIIQSDKRVSTHAEPYAHIQLSVCPGTLPCAHSTRHYYTCMHACMQICVCRYFHACATICAICARRTVGMLGGLHTPMHVLTCA